MRCVRTRIAVDVSGCAPAGVKKLVAEILSPPPDRLLDPALALCCVPGGGMSRRYLDLQVPAELGNYSMAEHFAARGFVVLLLDPPGVGDSDVPEDGYALTPDAVADLHACAFDRLLGALRIGNSDAALPALPQLVSIGVGHSAGGLLTAVQQARHTSHRALALLGVAGRGLPDQLESAELRYADDPDALYRDLPELVAARFGNPLPTMQRGSSQLLVRSEMEPAVRDALVAARAPLLALVGFASLVPGAYQKSFAAIEVPLFLGVGEHDITGDPHEIPAQFPNCRDLTLYVLPDSGHNHNVAPTRERLWTRLADWILGISR